MGALPWSVPQELTSVLELQAVLHLCWVVTTRQCLWTHELQHLTVQVAMTIIEPTHENTLLGYSIERGTPKTGNDSTLGCSKAKCNAVNWFPLTHPASPSCSLHK